MIWSRQEAGKFERGLWEFETGKFNQTPVQKSKLVSTTKQLSAKWWSPK